MSAFLPAILPVGLIILVGFVAQRSLALERQTLSQLIVYVLSPALIISSLYQTTISVRSAASLLAGYALTASVLYGMAWGVGTLLQRPAAFRQSLIVTTIFPNTGNLGLPVVAFVLGEAGLERAVIYLLASALLMYAVCPALLQGKGWGYGISMTLKLPFLWAMLAGFSLRLFPGQLPFGLDQGIDQLGQAAIPVSLVMLGMQLGRDRFAVGTEEGLAAALRLVGGPAIAYAVGRFMGLETLNLQVLVLQSAMPTAVNTFVMVTEFGGDAPRVSRTIVCSTLVSFITLPLVLWVIS
ncbi:MAG: AEC family transporter [Cyanophyceae cyanobacterium]